MFECPILALGNHLDLKRAVTGSGYCCLSRSSRTPKIPASNTLPSEAPLTSTGSPDNKLSKLNQESYCQGVATKVCKFQVPGLE